MRSRLTRSSIASAALVAVACAGPKQSGSLDSGSGGDAAKSSSTPHAGASSCESAGAAGVEVTCGSGGVAGGGGSSGGGSFGAAGGGGVNGNVAGGGSGGAFTGGGGAVAGTTNGGAGGGGGNGTGGMLSKCELLLLQANAYLQGAQTCSTVAGEPFCTGYSTNECDCKVPVNKADSLATENYVKARDAFEKECTPSCTTPCVEPKSQTCQLIFGLVVGACVAM